MWHSTSNSVALCLWVRVIMYQSSMNPILLVSASESHSLAWPSISSLCHLDIYWLNVWTWANQRQDTKIGKECKDIAFVINIYVTISTKRTTSLPLCIPKTWSSWTQRLDCADWWNSAMFLTVFCWNNRVNWIPGGLREVGSCAGD